MKTTLPGFILLLFLPTLLRAQEPVAGPVTSDTLMEIMVKGYGQHRRLREVAAPVSVITRQQLQRFGGVSIVQAVNTVPGVRMEERSPASYRLSIRGSSLRSPFGIRNVKIYWNGIPFTDPGGNTYLNQFSFYDFSTIEILKGPGSSLYGAGTGGVMLISSFTDTAANVLSANYTQGSFQSRSLHVAAITSKGHFSNQVSYTHQTGDGYREQSAMRRDIVTWEPVIKASAKQLVSLHFLYGDLFYETPGALTKSQYLSNPRAARPAAGGFTGAAQNHASIRQKTLWAGLQQQYQFNSHWQNTTSVYGAYSQVRNPAIRNYETRQEPHGGGRTTFEYSTGLSNVKVKVLAGAEYQQGFSTIRVTGNKAGRSDTLQTADEIKNRQGSFFAQTELGFPGGWIATAGISLNSVHVAFHRVSVVPVFNYTSRYNNELAPRLSLLKKVSTHLSIYGLVSRGFSPPTIAELLPSTSVINTSLQAEQGVNFELGVKGSLLGNRLSFDVNSFYFRLQQAITQRRDAGGADYFQNAGRTRQRGFETAASYAMLQHPGRFVTRMNIWGSHTYFDFRYTDFKQASNNFSGNRLPGVAPHTIAAGADVTVKPGLYASVNYFYSGRIALNDANAEFASAYTLLGFRTGYKHLYGKHTSMEFFVTADNLLNQQYSLGNDINAAGNRFYNAAPGADYRAGITLQYVFRQ